MNQQPASKYRVTNWKQYNQALVNRGNLTFWFEQDCWRKPKKTAGKMGRPFEFSDEAIVAMLILKQVFSLTLRTCEGFTKSLFELANLNAKVPSYTQLCRRQATVILPKLPVMKEPIHMVIDSSGLKIFGEGEWRVRQHGWSKRRTWRKLHIAMDEKSQLIVSSELTKATVSDDKKLEGLLEHYSGEISQVSADGAYDSHRCYKQISKHGAKVTIPPQLHPRHKPKVESKLKNTRDQTVWEIQNLGCSEWKSESGYHRRSLVENAFYRYKTLLGDRLCSRTLKHQTVEAKVRCLALNKITSLGMPKSIKIMIPSPGFATASPRLSR